MRTHRGLVTFVAAVGLLAGGAQSEAQCPASQSRYSILDLGTLGGPNSVALDIDSAGRVVGGADVSPGVQHPFLWEDGVLTDLGTLDGPWGLASGINESGQITGQADNDQPRRRAFLWDAGTMRELPTLGGPDGRGFDINDAGVVVGISNPGSGYQRAFRWDAGMIDDLGTFEGHNVAYANGINNAGQIAGWSGPSNSVQGARAWLLDKDNRTPLGTLGGTRSVAFDLDEAGRVVGWADVTGDATFHAFFWENGVMSDLGTLGGPTSIAAGANADDVVVGTADTADGSQHAFVYDQGQIADLADLIAPDTGIEPVFAAGVNPSGQIVGWASVGADTHAFLATPATHSVDDLIAEVESYDLPGGTANSLLVKLRHARDALDGCGTGSACGRLAAFTNEVRAQAGKKLTDEQAAALLAAVQEIIATLGC